MLAALLEQLLAPTDPRSEAIPERDPSFTLDVYGPTVALDGAAVVELTVEEAAVWRAMCARRPLLAKLGRPVDAPGAQKAP